MHCPCCLGWQHTARRHNVSLSLTCWRPVTHPPTHHSCAADGKLIDERNAPEFNIPTKPQYVHISLWTQTGWGLWGGTFDPNHPEPYWSQFTQALRVVCDLPGARSLGSGGALREPLQI
jgi:hypothetical protein